MLNPDEITGSPVKKVDFEYTTEYEKMRDTQIQEEEQLEEEEPIEEEVQEQSGASKFGSVEFDLAQYVNLKKEEPEALIEPNESLYNENDYMWV